MNDPDRPWNHNIHYHRQVLGALPSPCDRVLDVGCGEGVLARRLAEVAGRVTAIDRHRPSIERARAHPGAGAIDYVVGDVLTEPLAPASFDAVVAVASLHHLGTRTGLDRLAGLVKPGGTLVVVGLARSSTLADYAHDAVGAVLHRWYAWRREVWESPAPVVRPAPDTYRQVRAAARDMLPGARFRRRTLWRYTLVWRRPGDQPLP